MHYEVLLPDAGGSGAYDLTLTVEAAHWLDALQAALSRIGEPLQRGLLCRIDAGGACHVTDMQSQRHFRVVPLSARGASSDSFDTLELTPDERRALLAHSEAQRDSDESPRVVGTRRTQSGAYASLTAPPRPDEALIEQVLEELRWVYSAERSFQEVSERMLELAMTLMPSESGAVLFPGLQGGVLHFASARGPAASAAQRQHQPADQGLSGFCLREGVSMALHDAAAHPAFAPAIGRRVGYLARDALCAPLQFDGRVYGAIELINHEEANPYDFPSLALLTHIGSHIAQFVTMQS